MYGDSAGEEFACNEGDLALTPGLSRSPGEGNSHPLQYSGVENSMNCIVHGVTKSGTWQSDFHNMSVPISRFIPPPSSCLVTISLFSTSRTLFLFCKYPLYQLFRLHIWVISCICLSPFNFPEYNIWVHSCHCKWHYFFLWPSNISLHTHAHTYGHIILVIRAFQ